MSLARLDRGLTIRVRALTWGASAGVGVAAVAARSDPNSTTAMRAGGRAGPRPRKAPDGPVGPMSSATRWRKRKSPHARRGRSVDSVAA